MRLYLPLFLLLCPLLCMAGSGVVRVSWKDKGVKMSPCKVPGVTITTSKGHVLIENADTTRELTFRLSGTCSDGSLTYVGRHKVTFLLDGLSLTSQQGSPMDIRCSKRVAIKLRKDTHNELSDSPNGLSASGVLRCKGRIKIEGEGSLALYATGKGCKGIRTKGDFVMRGGGVSVSTTGLYAEEDTTAEFPPFPFFDIDVDDFPFDFGMEDFPFDFGMEDFPFDGEPPFRPRYKGTTKAIKALGRVIVEGGTLSVSTSTPGAEGIEGKQGVELMGGTVRVVAYDDAINSNGNIVFSGANVHAVSLHNDAVDSNAWGEGAITVSAGRVEVFSGAGPPEEGFDCDQWPIVIQGGEAFSVGSGMGPFPSLPNAYTAKQPYLLFQNIAVSEGDILSVHEQGGAEVIRVTTPVSNPMNHSLVTTPSLRPDTTYELRIGGNPVQERQPQ